MVFDTGQLLLWGGIVLSHVVCTDGVTCNYIDYADNGYQKTMQCNHGCCGNDANNQHCCGPNDNDNENQRLWIIIGAAVGGGLLLLALLILVVFCCIAKKNNAANKVHSGTTAGTEMYNVQTVRVPTPPPAYTYNAPNSMTGGAPRTGGTQQTNTGQRGLAPTNSQPGGSNNVAPTFHPPPSYSSLGKKPVN